MFVYISSGADTDTAFLVKPTRLLTKEFVPHRWRGHQAPCDTTPSAGAGPPGPIGARVQSLVELESLFELDLVIIQGHFVKTFF